MAARATAGGGVATCGGRPTRMPSIFVTHGGGPMPLLGERSHASLTAFLQGAAQKLLPARPEAVLLITAHWEERAPTLSTSPRPSMVYDYSGFPPESYKLKYPAPGPSPELAARVSQLLTAAGLSPRTDARRGYDHGTFVPLMLMFPRADVPVAQLSVMSSMDPAEHVKMGRALAPLRDEGVLILGSGSSFHNMAGFRGLGSENPPPNPLTEPAKQFDKWLVEVCALPSAGARGDALAKWAAAPGGRQSHPREEHLMPLLVAAAAGGDAPGRPVHQFAMGTAPVSSFMWD
mmetsp:Transcript_26706/g.79337  ORF Transcript_26706/g.79337 Transcript_26706/m.79337 type:complete len:290 (-) Transcript_26706:264-1133(-)